MELLLKEEENVKSKKRPSLLRRLSSNLSLASWKGEDDTPTTKDAAAQRNQPPGGIDRPSPSPHHQQERQPQSTNFGSMVPPPRWTPPLSPSSKLTRHSGSFSSFSSGEENRPLLLSPRGALKVLNSPGVPPLDELRQMTVLVGAASRAWLRDFLIRGGRRCVNAKVSEMATLEKEAKKRSRRVPLVPKVLLRKNSTGSGKVNGNGDGRCKGKGKGDCGLLPRPTLREIAEAREELMKLVVFLHLRDSGDGRPSEQPTPFCSG
eukprot:g4044.t1